MGLGIVIDPNPCAKISFEERLINDQAGLQETSLSSPVVIFRYPRTTPGLQQLIKFTSDVLNSSENNDMIASPLFGSRDGGGRVDLVCGNAIDPRCNPYHGNAIQFLDDQYVLDVLCLGTSSNSLIFATSVFLLSDKTSTKLNEGVLRFGSVDRVALVVTSDAGAFAIGNHMYPIMRKGEILVLSDSKSFSTFKVTSGSFIGVCFGIPGVIKSRSANGSLKPSVKSMTARVVLRSTFYNDIPSTVNRAAPTSGLYQTQIACPDCRRSVNITQDSLEKPARSPTDEEVNLVAVLWNSDMVDKLAKLDISGYKPTARWLLHTDESLVAGKIQILQDWPNIVNVRRLSRHNIKRGNLDSCVPAGFVSPTLFSRESDSAMYTLLQGLSLSELDGKLIRLVDLSTGDHMNIRARANLYKQLIYEIRDWNHPCHRPRRSAIGLLREWTKSYSLRDLA